MEGREGEEKEEKERQTNEKGGRRVMEGRRMGERGDGEDNQRKGRVEEISNYANWNNYPPPPLLAACLIHTHVNK